MGPEESEQYRAEKRKSAFDKMQEYNSEDEEEDKEYIPNEEYIEDALFEEEEEEEHDKIISKLNPNITQKYLELKSKISQAINQNLQSVKDENTISQDTNYEKRKLKEEYIKKQKEHKEFLQSQGVPEEKLYSLDSINKCEYIKEKQDKKVKNTSFAWDGIYLII